MKVFYARVSTISQNEARQLKTAEEVGAEKVFLDKISGASTEWRKQLMEMLNFVREGDIVYVSDISRLARNTKDLLDICFTLQAKGVELISMKENIDTRTPTGQFMLTLFGAMAQMERQTILERQREGILIAQAEGKYKGKPKSAIDEDKMRAECAKWRDGEQTAKRTMEKMGLKPNTFYRRVKELGL